MASPEAEAPPPAGRAEETRRREGSEKIVTTATEPHIRLPASIEPSQLTVVIDDREEMPVDVSPLASVRSRLDVGDYGLKGVPGIVCERKSLGDLVACCAGERQRFQREVDRLLSFDAKVLVVEATWTELLAGAWRSKATPQSVVGSVIRWQELGLPVALVGTHEEAGRFIARFLYLAAKRRWQQLRHLAGVVQPRNGQPADPNAPGADEYVHLPTGGMTS